MVSLGFWGLRVSVQNYARIMRMFGIYSVMPIMKILNRSNETCMSSIWQKYE